MAPHLLAGGRGRQRKVSNVTSPSLVTLSPPTTPASQSLTPRLLQVKKPEAERRRRARIATAVERLRMLLMEEGAAPPPPAPCTPPHLHHLSLAPRWV